MRSFRQFFPFGTLKVLNWARRRVRCVCFWSAGPAPNLTAMRRPNHTLHRMAAPPRSLVIRESQRAAIGELIVRSDQMTVTLREVTQEDLPIFFEHQLDAEATRMAAFPSRDHEAFMAHWARIMNKETN